jgi:HSP20 family molecular chaperone IbpA
VTTTHVHETATTFQVELELPEASIDADELEVTVLDHTVTVRGGREADPEGFGKRPGSSTAFRRSLELPRDADVEHLRATLRRGALELEAPKRRPAPRRIPVHVPCRLNGGAWAD